ncbi:MAG: 4Fe-4S dicluster domain-containing protein [Coriobacteriales bacterium]|jgi:Fe-S-cluster-containing dehydrogenase component
MQYAIVTECNKCVSCLACTTACKVENGAALGKRFTWIDRVGPNPIHEGDTFPNVEMYFLPMKCQHCVNPPCVSVCPTGASSKRDDGTVQVEEDACIGCGLCVSACPYGVRYVDDETQVAKKCTMCKQLIDKGEKPECVAACTGNALHFGDLDDPDSDVSKLVAQAGDKAYHLQDSGNSPASVYILDKFTWRS